MQASQQMRLFVQKFGKSGARKLAGRNRAESVGRIDIAFAHGQAEEIARQRETDNLAPAVRQQLV